MNLVQNSDTRSLWSKTILTPFKICILAIKLEAITYISLSSNYKSCHIGMATLIFLRICLNNICAYDVLLLWDIVQPIAVYFKPPLSP